MIELNLKEYRKKNKLTQSQLAIKSGSNQTYVSRLEANNFQFHNLKQSDRFIKVCKNLKVCPSEIIKYNCNNCVIKTTKCEKEKCYNNHISKGCSHMFILE